jgi:hypothetical protein
VAGGGSGGGGAPDAGLVLGACRNGFCWVSPLPLGGSMRAVSVADDHTVFTIGSGTVVRWDDGVPGYVDAGVALSDLVWARSATEVYFVDANRQLQRFDGASFTAVLNGGLSIVATLLRGDVVSGTLFACGGDTCERYDSALSSASDSTATFGFQSIAVIDGASALVTFPASVGGCLADQFAGSSLTPVPLADAGYEPCLIAAWGNTDLLMMATSGAYSANAVGGTWSPFPFPAGSTGFIALQASGPQQYWGLDMRSVREYRSGAWLVALDGGFSVLDVRGDAGFAAGINSAAALVHDGPGVSRLSYPVPQNVTSFSFLLGGTSNNDVWLVNDALERYHFDGVGWASVPAPVRFNRLASTRDSRSVVFLAGALTSSELRTGAAVQPLDQAPFATAGLNFADVTAVSANEIYAAGSTSGTAGVLAKWDGAAWSLVAAPDAGWLGAVWASSATNLWIGGLSGTLFQFNGMGWVDRSAALTPGEAVNDIWGTGPTDVFIAGDVLHHFTDAGMVTESPHPFSALAPADGTVWALGPSQLYERAGAAWSAVNPDVAVGESALYGAPDGGLWVAGRGNSVLFKP